MAFRFRKSIKIAPGVKINLGKKGASVTVGNKYARTTVGKSRTTNSVSIPGTGISYVKQTSNNTNSSKISKPSNSISPSRGNENQDPNQQISWATAFEIFKWTFYAFLAFFIFMMFTDSPAVLIGAAVIITGMILTKKKKQGKIKFKQTWIISTFGWLLTLILWTSNLEPEEINTVTPEPSNEINTLVSTPVEQKDEDEDKNEKGETAKVETEPTAAAAESIEPETTVVEEPVEEAIEEVAQKETTEPVVTRPVVNHEYYQNCTELRKVYPNGVSEDHPAYQAKMDRDKDGWACEK